MNIPYNNADQAHFLKGIKYERKNPVNSYLRIYGRR